MEDQTDKDRPMECGCLRNNILLESLVVTLTFLSALATSVDLLIVFDLITVPESRSQVKVQDGLLVKGQGSTPEIISENHDVIDILKDVCKYTSLAVAGLFTVEIFSKVCTLRKDFLSKPMQMFDACVVLLTLGSEVAFYVWEPPMDALLALSYIVLLRLWRIPALCNIRAVRVSESLSQDLELSESRRAKVEEKCARLEEVTSAQKTSIKNMQRALKNNPGANYGTGTEVTGSSSPTVRVQKNTMNVLLHSDEDFETKENKSTSGSGRLSRSGHVSTRQLRKTKKTLYSQTDNVELAKFDETDLRPPNVISNAVIIDETSFSTGKSRDGDGDGPPKRSPDINRDDVCKPNVDTNQRQKGLLVASNLPRPSQVNLRQKKRRSSTSEYIDYSNLSSPEKDDVFIRESEHFSQSCPILDKVNNNNSIGVRGANRCDNDDNKDSSSSYRSSQNPDTVDGNDHGSYTVNTIKQDSLSSHSSSETNSQNNMTGQRARKDQREYRRFASCPECVYTQRMGITNDESKLMDDNQVSDDQTMYDNLAFDYDEDARMQILAEFDGSKTYRSEDGIPMTSL